MKPFVACLAALVLLSSTTAPADDLLADTEAWRARRYESLKRPDGYLSFIGSGLVAEGESRVGSASDSDIVLPKGPAHLGTLTLKPDGSLHFVSAPEGGGHIGGKPFDAIALKTQLDENGPTRIDFDTAWFYVVRTGDMVGWRLRDTASPLRLAFHGIPHFPVDPGWRIQAHWEPFDPPRTLEYLTVLGTPDSGTVSGQAVFERGDETFTLWPMDTDDGSLFFVFADRTSGKTTYGGGRFLYADPPRDGHVVLDFNRAYNPPCALNGHVVCPTAPPENRLKLLVDAGERAPVKQ
ncbi:DUF1684 domain-containing protein [Xanthomonadaceae bacterium XH05]|nr:DUF1684 domain-containing protein [Xanthomonadaceae bacterium XH05]